MIETHEAGHDGSVVTKQTLVVNVPSFKRERVAVIVDVKNKVCAEVRFGNQSEESGAGAQRLRDRIGLEPKGGAKARDVIDYSDSQEPDI